MSPIREDSLSKGANGYVAERVTLAERVPLNAPLSVHISPTNSCNFRCFYCQHGNAEYHKQMHGMMSFADFKRAFLNITSIGMPRKIIFAGLGEPLLNPELSDMISFASRHLVYTVLLTNASLLSTECSDKLIEAGLDEMRVSLQGISDEQYNKVCGAKINFEQIISNIRYFYEHKGKCKIIVKMIDKLLESDSETERYFNVFKSITDSATIESLIPTNNIVSENTREFDRTLKGELVRERLVCPLPFYQIVVNYNGDIHCGCSDKCGTFGCPVIGNALENDMSLLWNKGRHLEIMKSMLAGEKSNMSECSLCNDYKYQGSSEDTLDDNRFDLINRMAGEWI